MSAAPSAACDIWSLGCTILELTTGKPPHFDLAPMAALFRIVQDDMPRLPAGASEALRDFLLQCFNREAVLRADAKALLSHAWLQRAPTLSMGIHVENISRAPSASRSNYMTSYTMQPKRASTKTGFYMTKTASDLVTEQAQTEHDTSLHVLFQTSSHSDVANILKKFRETEKEDIEYGFDQMYDERSPLSLGRDDTLLRRFGSEASAKKYPPGEASSTSLIRSSSISSEMYCWDSDQRGHDFEPHNGTMGLNCIDVNINSDPFTVGFLVDDQDFVHDPLRDREMKKREMVEAILFELATPKLSDHHVKKASSTLIDLLNTPDVEGENFLSESGAVSLIEALRNPSRAIEVLELTRTILLACENAANTLVCMGIAPLLVSLIPVRGTIQILDLLSSILDVIRLRCTEPYVSAFLFSGGLRLAVELLVPPSTALISPSRWTVALAGIEFLLCALNIKPVKAEIHGPSRIVLCHALALRDAPARLAASLEASLCSNTLPGTSAANAIARVLSALCDADAVVKETIASPRTSTVLLRVLAAFPQRVELAWACGADGHDETMLTLRLLKALKAVSMTSAAALDSLASCGAIETVVSLLKASQVRPINGEATNRSVPRQDEVEDQLVPTLYYMCRMDRTRLAKAARCGAAILLAACVARRRHLKQFALAILCEFCHVAANDAGGEVGAGLWRAGGVGLYTSLLVEAYWGGRALGALNSWLKADTRVESALAQPTCACSIVLLFRRLDRAQFEQTLQPLLDACKMSPRFVRALLNVSTEYRKHAFIFEVGRKLEKHPAAIIRKSLLEILRVSLAAATAPSALLLATNLDNVLVSLLTDGLTTDQVIVVDLARTVLACQYSKERGPELYVA